MYEIIKVHRPADIEVMPTSWRRRKNAEQAAKDLNVAERHNHKGGPLAFLAGEGPAKWQVTHSRVVSALLKRAFMLDEIACRQDEDDKPKPYFVVEDAA